MSQKDQRQHDWCDTETVLYRYRELLGWPVVTGTEDGDVILPASATVCSAALPIGLANEVQATLALRTLSGPIVLVPSRQHRWMMLATPPPEGAVPAKPVPGVDLRVVTNGPIVLPPSTTPRGPLRWVVPPSLSRPQLPPLSAIIAATRLAVSVSAMTSRSPRPARGGLPAVGTP